MRIVKESFVPGDFLVIRSFGKTRILRVTGRSRYVRGLGWHVRVRRVADNPQMRYLVKRLKVDVTKGGYLFWLTPYSGRKPWLLDLLTGRPRLQGFTTEVEAREKAVSLPDFDPEEWLLRGLLRLPEWLQPLTLIVVLQVRTLLRPRPFDRLPL